MIEVATRYTLIVLFLMSCAYFADQISSKDIQPPGNHKSTEEATKRRDESQARLRGNTTEETLANLRMEINRFVAQGFPNGE